MKHLTISEFVELTASKNAVPGGGSVAALCGGLGAALAGMVANLTIGNKRYPDVESKMLIIKEQSLILSKELLEYIEKDSEAFTTVMNSYKMPNTTDSEKKTRAAEIQKSLKKAAVVPLEIAEKALLVIGLSQEVVSHGNKNAVTDGMVSAMLARTAGLAALLNVRINLLSIKDKAFVEDINKKVTDIQNKCINEEQNILASANL